MGILRLAHVDVTVTDLDLATAYYTEVIGLQETERDADSVYLKCWDEPNHHSLRLIYGPRVGFEQMSFRVEHEDDLSRFENRVQQWGYPVRRVSKGEHVGQGESIRFETPSGQQMELVHDLTMVGRATSRINPAPFVEGLKGIAPPRLDHVLVTVEDLAASGAHICDDAPGRRGFTGSARDGVSSGLEAVERQPPALLPAAGQLGVGPVVLVE